jgi:hypothetical protein
LLAALLVLAAPTALCALALEQPWARLYLALAAACWGGLAWLTANATRVRGYNLASLLLFAASLGSLEEGLRFTDAGRFWDTSGFHGQSADSTATLVDQFEALEAGVPTTYPISGYPVALPPQKATLRIACMGGSSTAGAFQNDDIGQFYPADLDRLLGPDVEVVNQGVGAWNSFHIARFLEGRAATLEAEVWTLYLGVNEAVRTPRSYKELYADWQAGQLSTAPSLLAGSRLFTGLRLAARGLRGNENSVPPEDFADNLEHIASLAEERGVRVLLMSEGVPPRRLRPLLAGHARCGRGPRGGGVLRQRQHAARPPPGSLPGHQPPHPPWPRAAGRGPGRRAEAPGLDPARGDYDLAMTASKPGLMAFLKATKPWWLIPVILLAGFVLVLLLTDFAPLRDLAYSVG